MAYSIDDIRNIRYGRGTSNASSSDSSEKKKKYSVDDIREIRGYKPSVSNTSTDTSKSSSQTSNPSAGVSGSYITQTGNFTYDSLKTMQNDLGILRNALSTPQNMPTFASNDELKNYYESLGNYNVIERLGDKEKREKYKQKQALSGQYNEIKKNEDLKALKDYGITDQDMYSAAFLNNNGQSVLDLNRTMNGYDFYADQRKEVEDKFRKAYEETGINPYDYINDYKGEIAKMEANIVPVASTLNTYVQNPQESAINVAKDVYQYTTGKPITKDYSYTDTVRNEITENIDSEVGQFAYGTANSIGDMGMAMLVGSVLPGGQFVSPGIMGVEKASSVMNESVDRGLTPNQIMLEGIASGVTTAATEAIPMGKWEEVAKKGFVGLHGKALAKEIAKKFVANAIPEGFQEMAEDIADAIADDLIAGDKSEINTTIRELMEQGLSRDEAEAIAWRDWTKQMVLDGLGGFISGGVMSGGSIAAGLANPYATGEVNREGLSEQIRQMSPESETYQAYQKLAEKSGDNLENASENEVSDLFLKAYEEASKADRSALDKAFVDELKTHGYTDEQASETLEAVLAKDKTNYQKTIIDNILVKDALKKAESEEGFKMVQGIAERQAKLEETLKTSNQVKAEKNIAKAEANINTDTESSVNGEKVQILGMDIKGGNYVINTDKGTFQAEDVKVASSIKDAVAYSVNISDPNFKEAFVKNYKGQDISTYEAFAYQAYAAGKRFNASLLDAKSFSDFLGQGVTEDFLDAGRMAATRTNKESEERAIKAASEAEGKFKKGTFTSDVNYSSLRSTQKKVFNFLKGMSNIGGLNIHVIYDTNTDENGAFQYDSESGGTITVNLAATPTFGADARSSYVIPVLSHELTHYLEKNAENAYTALQKAVLKSLRAEGMDIDVEVNKKIEQYGKHNIKLTESEAMHEIIAQACEGMMSNTSTMEKTLSYMNEKEVRTFRKALDKFFNAVKQFVKSLAGDDADQNIYARAIANNIDEVQDAWAKAFATALERQQTLNAQVGLDSEKTADNGSTIVGENTAQFNIKTYEKSLPFLEDWLKKSGLSIKEQNQILTELEAKKDMLESIRKEFPHFDEWSMRDSQEEAIASFGDMTKEEESRMRDTVSKYLTAIVNNSEYPYNFDLTTVCKKRQTLNRVLNMLVEDGMFDDFIPDEKTMTDMVDLIKANGFEVACALCFVDSKRYRVGSWADSIVNGADAYNQKKKVWVHSYGWNEIVKSMEVKGKVSVNDFNFLDRDIDNDRPYRLASNMTIDELREAGALKLIDKIMKTESGNTRNKKFAKAILENPSLAHTANVAELLSSEGLDIARIKAPDFHQVVNGASGQATPKLSHDAITYQNDILRKLVEKNVTPEDLYKVGGFRVQSFSDYVANEIFDYVQMVSELAANQFPSHAYTKEYFFVKLFGMTGMKINMSIVPKALADNVKEKFKGWSDTKKKASDEYQMYKSHAGLSKGTNEDGSFDWEDETGKWHYIIEDESFGAIRDRKKNTYDAYAGFKRALEIQSDPRYNGNCGIIWVGVSDAHIRAMMRDKRIPMVIPYHKSSINHLVAEMRAIDTYNDYTDYQVEKYLNGNSMSKPDYSKVMGDWDFYADLRSTKDPVQTSKNYIKYCLDHGVRPVFYQFAFEEGHEGDYDYFEEGYYKLLTDFRLYGGNTDGTMNTAFAEQGPVTMSFPEEFNNLAKESLAEYEEDSKYLDKNQEKLYKEAKKLVEKNKKEQKAEKQMSLKEDSEGRELSKGQQNFFKDSKVRDENGRLKVMYHGARGVGFTVFNADMSDDKTSLFFTDSLENAKSYSGTKEIFNPDKKMTFDELNDVINSYRGGDWYIKKDGKDIVLYELGAIGESDNELLRGSLKDIQTYFIDSLEDLYNEDSANYEVYLNITNPLMIDARNNNWDEIFPDEFEYHYNDVNVTKVDENTFEVDYGDADGEHHKVMSKAELTKQFGNNFFSVAKEEYDAYYLENVYVGEDGNIMPINTRQISQYAKENGYDGVIIDNVYDYGLYTSKNEVKPSQVVIAYNSNQIKSVYNENPTKNNDIRYSIKEDSEGNKLTKDQAEYFINSKVVDENGRLEVMYHGTWNAGFTKFGIKNSSVKNASFFTNDKFVAFGYSGVQKVVDPYKLSGPIKTVKDLNNRIIELGYEAKKDGDDIVILYKGREEIRKKNVKDALEKFITFYEPDEFGGAYKVYLNAQNPLVIDAQNNYWSEVNSGIFDKNGKELNTTDELAEYAQKNGYDSIIINNVIDSGKYADFDEVSKVVAVFNPNQIKAVNNLTPTENADIRYSLRTNVDTEGNKLSKGQQSFFKNSKAVDNKGRLLKMYHGSENSGFAVFKANEFVKEINGLTKVKGYFGTNPEYSEAYGDVSSFYLNVINPIDFRDYNGDGSLDSYRAFLKAKGVNNVKFDSGPQKDSLVGAIFKNEKGEEYKSYIPYELFDQIGHYWNGDGNLTEAISNAGYDSVIWYEGYNDDDITILPFNENAIKRTDNLNPTSDERISYSIRDEAVLPDDEKQTYSTLEDDVRLLRDFTKLSKEDMKWQSKDMIALADYLVDKYDSTISKNDLREELAELYNSIPESSDNWLSVMDACYRVASEIYEVSNNKVKVDADVDPEARQTVAEAKRRNAIQQIAIDIYNKYWTMASYYSNTEQAKALKAKHRQNIKSAVEKQKLADTIYYKALIEQTKRKTTEEKAKIREKVRANAELQKEATAKDAQIEKITDSVKTMSKWLYQNSKDHPVPEPLKEPLGKLIEAIDPSSNQLLKTGKPTKKDETLSLWLHRVANVLTEINNGMANTDNSDEANIESSLGMLDLPPYMVDEMDKIATTLQNLESEYDTVGAKVLRLMDLEDLKKLDNDIKALKGAINTINEAISTKNKVKVNYVGQKIIQYLKKLPQAKRDALIESLTRGVDFLTLDNTTPFYYFKHMGEGGRLLFDILADGMDNMTNLVEEISKFTGGEENEKTHKKEGGLYTEKEQNEWRNNIREFELVQKLTDTERAEGIKEKTVKVKLTDAQIMSLYCLSKREVNGRRQAMEHILRDGIAIGKIDGKKKVARQDTVTITESQLRDIISIVENDERMKAVADGLQHFMSTVCSDWGNKVTMARWGIKQFTEKFYFPIAVNGETTSTNPGDEFGSLFSLLNKNFTKPLRDEVRNEIMVYDIFDVFTQHTSDMARYSALGLPILDTIKVWNYSEAENKGDAEEARKAKANGEKYYQQRKVDSVKKSIAKAFGEKGGNKYMSLLIKNLNGQADRGVYDNIGMGLVKRYKSSKVAASLITAMVQPLSYIRAGYMINPRYLTAALLHAPKVKKCFNEVGVAKWKSMSIGVDTNIGRGVDRIINNQNKISDKILDKSLWLAEKMDELTWGYIYSAVELETKATHKNLDPESDEFKNLVNERAREVFYGTQIFDSTLTRSSFMRDKGSRAVMLSAFMSEPTLSYNMLLDAATEYYQDAKINGSSHAFKTKGKVVASAISVYVLSSVVESALREVLTRLRDYDDDDEAFFDGFIEAFVDRLLDELNPLNKIPYCKQLMDGLSAFKKAYRSNNKMDEAFIADIASAYKAIEKAKENQEISYKTIWTTFNALSDVTGLPFANALREAKAVWNNTVGRITGEYFK